MVRLIAPSFDFEISGEVEVYATVAAGSAPDGPFGYDLKLTSYQGKH